MKRRAVWLFELVVCLCGLVVAARNKPNVIVLLVDDLGYNDLGYMGSPDVKSPHIDRLIRDGVFFSDAYSVAGFCSPARAGLLSGIHPFHIGHWYNPPHDPEDTRAGIRPDVTLLPETLGKRGYKSLLVGKWHLGFSSIHHPLKRGFDNFFGFLGGKFTYFDYKQQKAGDYQYIYKDWDYFTDVTHLTDDWFKGARDYITDHKDKPFFIYLSINAPHGPYEPKPEDIDPKVDPDRQVHVALIKGIDDNVKKLRGHINRLGLKEDTIIIFANDNGGHANGANNYPLSKFKGSLYEGGVRIPMSITWPGTIKRNQVSPMLASLLDIYPTVERAANVGKGHSNPDLQGLDLLKYVRLEGDSAPRKPIDEKRTIINRRARGNGAVRVGELKVYLNNKWNVDSVWNLTADIGETTSIKGRDDDIRAVQQECKEIFKSWNAQVRPATFPASYGAREKASNPISLSITRSPASMVTGERQKFESVYTHENRESPKYAWEVFRAAEKVYADYNELKPGPEVAIATRTSRKTWITIDEPGRWIVRINVTDGRFLKWVDVELEVQSNTAM